MFLRSVASRLCVKPLFFGDAVLIPKNFSLLPYQEAGVKKLLAFLRRTNHAYCCDDQGLGKTIQTATVINELVEYDKVKKVIIVTPASLVINFAKEVKKWSTHDIPVYILGSTKNVLSLQQKEACIVVISYSLIQRKECAKKVFHYGFDFVVFDESHYLKNPEARTTRFCLDYLWPRTKYRLALSGTPIPNYTPDAFTLFSKFLPKQWACFETFANQYSYPMKTKFGVRYQGGKNLQELGNLARRFFMVRRLKKNVLTELPPKILNTIEFDIVERGHSTYDGKEIARAIQKSQRYDPTPMATKRKRLGIAKVQRFMQILLDELVHSKPVIVFAYHKEVIHLVMEQLSEAGFTCSSFTGDTPKAERHDIVERFQNGEIEVLVANYIAAGTGLTLTRANVALFLEMPWSAGVLNQACDRLHRIGQKDVVRILFCVARNSMDELICRALKRKLKVISEVLGA